MSEGILALDLKTAPNARDMTPKSERGSIKRGAKMKVFMIEEGKA
jgi:hypothetical protein